jgi:S-formylglutathione hydrolase FrmB
MRYFVLLVLLVSKIPCIAGKVDTISIYSQSMQKDIKCIVIKPGGYKKKHHRYSTVYLLHGYSGSYDNWIRKVPELSELANRFNLLIVCPDGGYSSWYFDSPVDTTMRYETHIVNEVVPYIDRHYKTIPNRNNRAITGLSMGGHGALFLAFRNAGIFSAAGSMSGGVDLSASRNRFDIMKRIGDTITYADNWRKYSVINIIDQYPKDSLDVMIDCGTEDFFYTINHALHEKMLRLKIPHDYTERPGAHNWAYWSNAVLYQLTFFRKNFKE